MFKMPITFIGYDGTKKTKDFYFNLTNAEIAKIHLSLPGGLDGFMEKLKTDENPDPDDVISVFEKIILTSYGKRTSTNAFIKSKEISQEFAATDAYSELFLMFLDNKDDFVNKFLQNVITAPPGTLEKIFEKHKSSEPKQLNSSVDENTAETSTVTDIADI